MNHLPLIKNDNLFRGLISILPTLFFGILSTELWSFSIIMFAVFAMVFLYFAYHTLSGFAWYVNDCFGLPVKEKELNEAEKTNVRASQVDK